MTKQQDEIRALKSDKNLLEIQINSLKTDLEKNKFQKGTTFNTSGQIFNDIDFKYEYNSMKNQLEVLRRKVGEYENKERDHQHSRVDDSSISSYIKKMKDLEQENEHLKRELSNNNPQHLPSGNELVLQKDLSKLRVENEILVEELSAKNDIIKKLNNGKLVGDVEAMENLRKANERLMKNIVELQEQLNQSYNTYKNTDRSMTNPGNSMGPGYQQNPRIVRSEFTDSGHFKQNSGLDLM